MFGLFLFTQYYLRTIPEFLGENERIFKDLVIIYFGTTK